MEVTYILALQFNQQQLSSLEKSSPLNGHILSVPAQFSLFWHPDCVLFSTLILLHSSLTESFLVTRKRNKCKWERRCTMKVVRQRRGEWGKEKGWLGGWVGVWLLNKDFRKTSWKYRLHRVISRSEREQRPWAQMEGLKGWYKVLCGSESDCLEEEVQLQRQAYLHQADWLTDFTINSLSRYPAHFYTHSSTFLPPPTHCISYTHIDKGAAQLMLM